MTTVPRPMCLYCRHLRNDRVNRMTCSAFPAGIPEANIQSRADHRRPYRGDGGVRFDPRDAAAAEYAD